MAELGSTGSDDDNNNLDDDDDPSSGSSNDDNNTINPINRKINTKQEKLMNNHDQIDDVDDDELERLARINAEFNTNNLSEKPLKSKGMNFFSKNRSSILRFSSRNITYISSNTS
jgi:hypothetical protein